MSSASPPAPSPADGRPTRVVVISHSPLFYWWPVWAVGFLMAVLSYLHGERIAFVPSGTVAARSVTVSGEDGPRDVLIAPAGTSLPADSDGGPLQPELRMTISNDVGIIWMLTLFLVIVVTNIPLRGLWSLIVMLVGGFAVVLLAILDLLDPILRAVRVLDIHMTSFSYLTISLILFVIWLVTVLIFDRMVYMIFTRNQLRVRMAISQGETVFDTRGLVLERHRDDLFRHWLLGFGSGDLTVRTSGTGAQQLEMPNVLFVGHKLTLINRMLQEHEVIKAPR